MTTIRQSTREADRDRGANSGEPPATGAGGRVSPESLTRVAVAAAAAEQAAGQSGGLSSDLGAALRAATPPRGPQGTARAADTDGARPETGGRTSPDRGPDRGPDSR
ncbi:MULTISPECIES: hypothetical protein [Kribbella]|uniref:Uncharacterized protein n=1 Tax=Kribbella karoonensis TaxID=324851 RepID=A0ABN2DX75_9ACTN